MSATPADRVRSVLREAGFTAAYVERLDARLAAKPDLDPYDAVYLMTEADDDLHYVITVPSLMRVGFGEAVARELVDIDRDYPGRETPAQWAWSRFDATFARIESAAWRAAMNRCNERCAERARFIRAVYRQIDVFCGGQPRAAWQIGPGSDGNGRGGRYDRARVCFAPYQERHPRCIMCIASSGGVAVAGHRVGHMDNPTTVLRAASAVVAALFTPG